MMGGRVAEELKFEELTSGASSDIQKATQLARAMVTEWGMSEKLGPLHYGESGNDSFMMGPQLSRPNYSAATAREIDAEVKRLVEAGYEKARDILTEHRGKLDAIAEALLERETLDGAELEAILDGRDLPPVKKVVIPSYSEKQRQSKERRKSSIFQPRPREVPSGG